MDRGDARSFKILSGGAGQARPSVLIASADDAVRFVLSDWSIHKGLSVIIAYDAAGVWAAAGGAHAVRLVLYTLDAVGAAAIEAFHELTRRNWFAAQVPSEVRAALERGQSRPHPPADPLAELPLWRAIDRLLEATLAGALGPIALAGPRIAKEAVCARGYLRPSVRDKPAADEALVTGDLACGRIRIDVLNDRVYVDGVRCADVSGTLFQVLKYMMLRPGKLIPWSEIDVAVFGVKKRSNEAHRKTVQRLRAAMKNDHFLIVTTRDCIGIQLDANPLA
jgi:DNA-binding response OmpR family regulator